MRASMSWEVEPQAFLKKFEIIAPPTLKPFSQSTQLLQLQIQMHL
jgi:hypothetical protein